MKFQTLLGDLGWHWALQHDPKFRTKAYTRVSPIDFYAHKLMVRNIPGEPLPHAGRFLFQQYIVDSYCKAEARRLQYIRDNQLQLRAESYKGLQDYVQGLDEGVAAHRVGKKVILPSTYAGAPRALQQHYLDAMAIVRCYGKPDYFLTFTANPMWEEVTAALGPNEHPHDRPDILARVFHLKVQQFLKEILEEHVLGEVMAYCWSIEFQKRGLPHLHLLICLRSTDKAKTTADIDSRVCAELPVDPDDSQRELYETIERCMIHGPCGSRNPKAPCMGPEGCSKNYPKPSFVEATEFNDGYYPTYRRRETSDQHQKSGTPIDNRDVVPYNPYFTRRFNAHINVEIVSSLKSVKYIYKYILKGHDRAAIIVKYGGDEVHAHLDTRYVGPAEACWRLFSFPLHGMSHSVVRLAVHLPDQQPVAFVEKEERNALDKASDKHTTLQAWFKLNRDKPDFRHLLYVDMPKHCVWNKKAGTWKPRQRGAKNVLGRLNAASPAQEERYFLYLLLLNVPGATGFEDLRRVPGQEQPAHSFQEAAVLRGLVESEEEYRLALRDAAFQKMPGPLRQFFAHLLLSCSLTTGKELWEEFRDDLAEGYGKHVPLEQAHDFALQDIQKVLETAGKKNSDYEIPNPAAFNREVWMNRDLQAEIAFDQPAEQAKAAEMRSLMYPEQAAAFDEVRAAVDAGAGGIYFVDGPGGTGKSFLFEALLHHVRGEGKIGVACAWSGLAASLLPGGRTASARFGLPVPLPEESVQFGVTAGQAKGRLLQASHLLIWDEVSMAPREAVEAADACLRDICGNELPFGGKVVFFGGDFRQVLPVIPRAGAERIKSHVVTRLPYFQDGSVKRHTLANNMRAAKDKDYSKFLLSVGDGAFPTCAAAGEGMVRLPERLLMEPDCSEHDLAEWVFGDMVAAGLRLVHESKPSKASMEALSKRAILAPKNDVANSLNHAVLQRFPAASIVQADMASVWGAFSEEAGPQ